MKTGIILVVVDEVVIEVVLEEVHLEVDIVLENQANIDHIIEMIIIAHQVVVEMLIEVIIVHIVVILEMINTMNLVQNHHLIIPKIQNRLLLLLHPLQMLQLYIFSILYSCR